MKTIFVNQVGYYPEACKIALAEVNNEDDKFFAVTNSNGNTVFEGEITKVQEDSLAGGKYGLIDFSALKMDGTYTIRYAGTESYSFKIGKDVLSNVSRSAQDYFTLSRCGCQCNDSVWGHPVCHGKPATIYGTNIQIDATGGWHDAGDYGRYVVACAKTMCDLLLSLEANPDTCGFDTLDEIRWAADWMLKMQRDDGGVYHKVTPPHFCGFIMPQDEVEPEVVCPVSTAATADFAGTLAYAQAFYKNKDPDYAKKLLDAAIKAQNYLDCHEDEEFKNPQGISTGEYGSRLGFIFPERYFALCELYVATGEKKYLESALKIRRENKIKFPGAGPEVKPAFPESFGWGCVSGYGTEVLLNNREMISDEVFEELKASVLEAAEKIVEVAEGNIFAYANKHVGWGSNGALMDNAHTLNIAYKLTGNKSYLDLIFRSVDFLLGCNPLAISYVTGTGTYCMEHPHHRPSGFLKRPMPGMLSGGPCAGLLDKYAQEHLQGAAPLKCFVDHPASYSTNEIDNYWNSPFVLVLAIVRSQIQ